MLRLNSLNYAELRRESWFPVPLPPPRARTKYSDVTVIFLREIRLAPQNSPQSESHAPVEPLRLGNPTVKPRYAAAKAS